jgi:endonuclease G
MFRLVAAGLFLTASTAFANPIDDKCPEVVWYGAPQIAEEGNNQYICHSGYAINYNYETKVAHFVVEHIQAEDLVKTAKRKDDFRMDPKVEDSKEATLEDYAGTGYDRGHIAPAANFSWSEEEMSESFYLTNMMPQVPNNNRGVWKKTETMARENAAKRGEVYVISGTIFSDGYKTIGEGKVGVPQRVYKIIIDPRTQESIAFVFPNEMGMKIKTRTLPSYVVDIDYVESATGIDFSPMLKDESMEAVEADIKNWE